MSTKLLIKKQQQIYSWEKRFLSLYWSTRVSNHEKLLRNLTTYTYQHEHYKEVLRPLLLSAPESFDFVWNLVSSWCVVCRVFAPVIVSFSLVAPLSFAWWSPTCKARKCNLCKDIFSCALSGERFYHEPCIGHNAVLFWHHFAGTQSNPSWPILCVP